MVALSAERILAAFERGDEAETADARGAALEDLVAYIVGRIPGVRFQQQAVLVANNSEELDLVFWNNKHPDGVPFLPNVLMFECKNWAHRVGSPEVTVFIHKAIERHLEYAFLIAASGVTGDGEGLRAANQHIDTAFISASKLHLIVITRDELCALTSTEDFIVLVQDKISKIEMRVRQI